MLKNRTTHASGVLLALDRRAGRPMREQLEMGLRTAIHQGRLSAGDALPSSRAFSRDLGVSRGVVVEAYAQLLAEGYLTARSGSGTRVADGVRPDTAPSRDPVELVLPRWNFRPGIPDLGLFPRSAWAGAVRRAVLNVPVTALGYGDPRGAVELRQALARYLARVRGVVADPQAVIICTGFTQALALLCQVLRDAGEARIALEDPTQPDEREIMSRAGLTPAPVPVDADGLRVDLLARTDAGCVLVTPAHQFPTGVVLAPARRAALIAWARERDAVIVEDDYDAEYRYDREPVGALQGLAPAHVVYAGSVSKTLAPALRLGWIVPPARLVDQFAEAKRAADLGSPVLDQLAFAEFLESGALDRHLRRVRLIYRRRRDTLVRALTRHLPRARVSGIAAGLHAVVDLPPDIDEAMLVAAADARSIRVYGMSGFRADPMAGSPALVMGYANLSEREIEEGVAGLGRI